MKSCKFRYINNTPIKIHFSQILTINRVKSLIKEDVEVKSISTEACFAVSKATVRQIYAHVATFFSRCKIRSDDAIIFLCYNNKPSSLLLLSLLQEQLLDALADRGGKSMFEDNRSTLAYNDVGMSPCQY